MRSHPDTALLALQPEVDEINTLCDVLARRVSAAKALRCAGVLCPHLRAEEAAEEAAANVWIEIHDRIAATRAMTLAGIQFKAQFSPTPWLDPVMMRSIVLDLLAMTSEDRCTFSASSTETIRAMSSRTDFKLTSESRAWRSKANRACMGHVGSDSAG